MTRLFTDGAEMGDLSFWDIYIGMTASTTQKKTGSYSYGFNNDWYGVKYLPDLSEFYFKCWWFFSDAGEANASFPFTFRHDTTAIVGMGKPKANDIIHANVSSASVASGSTVMTNATWHLLEAYFNINASGQITIKVDGIQEIDYYGNTVVSGNTHINNIYLYAMYNNIMFVDDMALNSTDNSDGKNDNSWCGDGRVIYLPPVSNGSVIQWTPSSASSSNFQMIDDIPPDSDTTYITAAGASLRDIYNLSSFSLSDSRIKRVWTEARAKDFSGTGSFINLGIKTGGCVVLSSASRALTAGYTRKTSDEFASNPSTGTDWQVADLANVQIVVDGA